MRRTASRPSTSAKTRSAWLRCGPVAASRRLAIGLEAGAAAEHQILGGHQLGEALPLVHHAQAVHQDLLGAEQIAEAPRVFDLPRAEAEGAVGPAQHVEEGLAREQVLDLAELTLRDPLPRHRQPRQHQRPGVALALQLVDPLAGELPAAHEHLPQRRVRTRADRGRGDDGSAIEQELDRLVAAGELEHARLALLSDQLEDLGDAEVPEVPVQPHRHG